VKKLLTALLVVGSMAMTGAVCAQDFQKGLKAYEAKDYTTALKEWRFLAERGNAIAQLNLAMMFKDGLGIAQDYREAVGWFRKAAEQGHANAQNNLALMYEYGRGVKKDNVFGHMWWNIAASNGAENASKWRDKLAAKMTGAELTQAQELARECMKKQYKDC